MAFLVCYSKSAPHDHAREKAIYLDQKFYELIFRRCTKDRSYYANLSVIASLRYKSPLIIVDGEQIDLLAQELDDLEGSGHTHPQLAEFRQVCTNAKTRACNLSISGDMHPEL